MSNPEIRILEDADALARAAAEIFVQAAAEAIGRKDHFTVALAGGSTPRRLYSLLAGDGELAFATKVPWRKTHFFWGDERHLPPDHPDSNYRMVREILLSRVPVPEENINRIRTEEGEPARAAAHYDDLLQRRFNLELGTLPGFDLILLGMGADGHTASLFPGSPALEEHARLVAAVHVPEPGSHRITLTLPVLNFAARVLFLVAGPDKAPAVRAVLEGGAEDPLLPAGRVRPSEGRLVWLLDRAAAENLRSRP